MTMAERFAEQAASCARHGSPLYEELLTGLAADIERGGPTAELLARFAEAPPRLLPLRLLGGLHALVLRREAPELALYYPSVGGTAGQGGVVAAALAVIDQRATDLQPWLSRDPQTNEVGRSAALLGALSHAVASLPQPLPIRLLEVGASAGLNLRVDRYRIAGRGPADSPVVLDDAWQGEPPPDVPLNVIDRIGVDLHPVDPLTPSGRLLLTAYVWPDDTTRIERLRGALRVAQTTPVRLVAQDAVEAVSQLHPQPGLVTVLWHSVAVMYLSREQRRQFDAAVDRLGESADAEAPVAHLTMEPVGRVPNAFPIRMRTYPNGEAVTLGLAAPHGLPVVWGA